MFKKIVLICAPILLLLSGSAFAQGRSLTHISFAQDGNATYRCSGLSTFNGEMALTRDKEPQVPGVDATYFGWVFSTDPATGSTKGIVMVLAGKKRAEPGLNRIILSWAYLIAPQGTYLSSSTTSNQLLLQNGGTSSLYTYGPQGNLDCSLTITIPDLPLP
ncbi:MAG: hypothetical protein J0M12_17380 [Deltaproteobacteria bacterium]|nr:hypothetical protein [Deltaproteobacteria bacterium]